MQGSIGRRTGVRSRPGSPPQAARVKHNLHDPAAKNQAWGATLDSTCQEDQLHAQALRLLAVKKV